MIRRTNRKWQGQTYHTYYMDVPRGGELVKLPGVTTILKCWPKGEVLTNWAARAVAEFVADNWEQVQALYPMGRQAVIDNLKGQHWATRDAAAATGLEIHGYAQDLVVGAPVDVPEHLVARVTGYAKWLDEWQIDPIATERTVASRRVGYAGTYDLHAVCEAGPWAGRRPLFDVKSGRGAYGEAGIQLAAYASAELLMGADGAELAAPEVDCTAVVHVTDEGTAVYPTADGSEAISRQFGIFRHLAWIHRQLPYVDGVRGGAPGLIDTEHPLYASGDPGAGWES